MKLYHLLSNLRVPVYMQLRDESNMEIINSVKSDSEALTQYHDHDVESWGTCIMSDINKPQFYVLIK